MVHLQVTLTALHGLQKHKEIMRVIEVSKAQGSGTEVEGGGNCHISGYTNSVRER